MTSCERVFITITIRGSVICSLLSGRGALLLYYCGGLRRVVPSALHCRRHRRRFLSSLCWFVLSFGSIFSAIRWNVDRQTKNSPIRLSNTPRQRP